MKKRVGILTLQFADNYGGLLQTYALSKTIDKLGHTPQIINRLPLNNSNAFKKIIQSSLTKSFASFRFQFLKNTTEPIYTSESMRHIGVDFDTVIVGSDQVWRLEYTLKEGLGLNMFLDFVPKDVQKLAYAASFGKENFEGDEDTIENVRMLLSKFDGIAVREDSGVAICKDVFNVLATHVLDPTMLLEPSEYDAILQTETYSNKDNFVTMYFLDTTSKKLAIANAIAKKYDAALKNIYRPSSEAYSVKKHILPLPKFAYPTFPNWINGVKNAQFVVADSFHGVVFSILFNKQFICVANKSRGIARMESLLKQFGLLDRLIFEEDAPESYMSLPDIDFTGVNQIIERQREISLKFLKEHLG